MSWISDIFSNPAEKLASRAKRAEAEKQRLIDEGMERINAIFGGGSYPVYTTAQDYASGGDYYRLNKNTGKYELVSEPRTYPTGKAPSQWDIPSETADQLSKRLQRQIKKGKLYTMGTSPEYKGYTPEFYQNYAKSYVDFAMPQLKSEFLKAFNQATFGLADRGLLESSVAEQTQSGLKRQYGQQTQQVYETGQSYAQEMKSAIEKARQDAISLLYTTSDPAQAEQSALSTAYNAPWPNTVSSLFDVFWPTSGSGSTSTPTGGGMDLSFLQNMFKGSTASQGAIPKQ